ncbi:hypothetical protein HWV62_32590 [Athelia sp. TMB]|nr:hypothetical protein HWV62_32590 [Athelia sp. TMB]
MENVFQQIAPVLDQIQPSSGGVGPSTAIGANMTTSLASAAELLQSINSRERGIGGSSSVDGGNVGTSVSTAIKIEDDVSEQFGQLALDEHGGMRWIGGSSTMSLIQSFRALTTSPMNRVSPMEEDPRAPGPSVNKLYFPASVFFGKVHALPGPEEAEYPERDLADKLVDAYFARFHFLMPVIDKPSFLRRYNHLIANKDDPALARSEAPFMALVFSVFACSAKLVEDPRLATGDTLDDGGMGMVYYESHASIQISHVQCLILMSSFLCSVNCLPQAWLLTGQAVRTAQDLGLHRSPRRLTITPIEKETRRKIWWGVYSLDRMLAMALGRPLGIEDTDCDVDLPVNIDDENLQEYFSLGAQASEQQLSLMAGTNALTGLYHIAGRVLRQVYALDKCKDNLEPEKRAELHRTVEALDKELTKWCDDLPVQFKSEPVTEKQVSMGAILCSHYYSVLTTLHRNFLPVKREQAVVPKSTAKAVSSARSCIRLAPSIKNVIPPSHHLAFFIQHLFSSAVIVLLYAMHAGDPRAAHAAMEEGKSCLGALESWEGYWPGARKCKELLSELAITADEAIRKAANGGDASNAQAGPSGSSSNAERRRSVTISTVPTSPTPGRALKNKPRKISRSRDPYQRRQPVASVIRGECAFLATVASCPSTDIFFPKKIAASHRARSTSRKRGHDEGDLPDGTIPYSIYGNPNTISPHSSPSSRGLPSPSMSSLEPTPTQEAPSPRLVAGPSYSSYTNNSAPLSPLHVPTQPQQYNNYDYGNYHSPLAQSSTSQWPVDNNDQGGMEMYSANQYSGMPYSGETLDSSQYVNYGGTTDVNGTLGGLSTTPPTASFDAPGLPFRGLDFIRNYPGGSYAMGNEQDSLWQTFDSSAFGVDPDIPFFLPDLHNDGQDGQFQHQHHQ